MSNIDLSHIDSIFHSDFVFTDINGKPLALSQYKNHVLLMVNVASKCGFTPQYTGLEELWVKYQEKGLIIIGSPCNQFGFQEPGNDDEIKTFCSTQYEVTFPLTSKIEVNGSNAHPVWQWLKHQKSGVLGIEAIKWNFTKFLIGRDGKVINRYAPIDKPAQIESDIISALQ